MKRKLNLLLVLVIALVACLSLAACNTTLEQLQNDYGITVEGGGFEKGASLVSEVIDATSEKGVAAIQAIAEQDYDKSKDVHIFDIFVAKDGAEVQPNGKVKVTIPAPIQNVTDFIVFHIKDSGVVEKLIPTFSEGKISFETDSFSYFVVVEANEAAKYTLNVRQQGAGGSVQVNKNTASSLVSNPFSGETAEGSAVTLVASTRGAGYNFVGWFEMDETDLTTVQLKDTAVCTTATYSFNMPSSDYTVYAVFEEVQTYAFQAVRGSEGGKIYYNDAEAPNGVSENLIEGATISVTAIPDYGYVFKGWFKADETIATHLVFEDTPVSTDSTKAFTMPATDYRVYAVFEEVQTYAFQAVRGSEGGKIYYNDAEAPNGVSENLIEGATISVTAIPDYGYVFKGWFKADETIATHLVFEDTPVSTDSTKAFTMPATDYRVYAVFEEVQTYAFQAVRGSEGGKIYYNDAEAPNGVSENLIEGATISVTAIPDYGYVFKGWFKADETIATHLVFEDTPVSTDSTKAFTMPATDYRVYAVFEEDGKNEFRALYGNDGGTIFFGETAQPNGYNARLAEGAKVTLTATPSDGYVFLGWYEKEATVVGETERFKDTAVSTSATYEFTMIGSEYNVFAVYEAVITSLSLDGANCGFSTQTVTYIIGADNAPVPANVVVYGVTVEGNVYLTLNTDYTVNLGGLDLTNVGTYTITYTYVENTSITATLTVNVEKPKFAFQALVDNNGKISKKSVDQPNGYYAEVEEGTKITLTATADVGYEFVGWFEPNDTPGSVGYKDTAVSTSATYEFTSPANAYNVYAVFQAIVTGLSLDGANAGFVDNSATYEIGAATQPTPNNVLVYGVTIAGNVVLTNITDYTIDLGGLNFETAGEYTVIYTYVKNTSLTASVTVNVVVEI